MFTIAIIGGESDYNIIEAIKEIILTTQNRILILDNKNIKSCLIKKTICMNRMVEIENYDVAIIKLEEEDFFNLNKNIFKFDIIIYPEKTDDYSEGNFLRNNKFTSKVFYFLNVLRSGGYLIYNSDIRKLNLDKKFIINKKILSYGFNCEADITLSSNSKGLFEHKRVLYLQRKIFTYDSKLIEPQEYLIKYNKKYDNPYLNMILLSLILYSSDLKEICNFNIKNNVIYFK